MRFHVTFSPALHSPIKVDIDGDFYTTSVSSTSGQFYIDFDNRRKTYLRKTLFSCGICSDSEWYYDKYEYL